MTHSSNEKREKSGKKVIWTLVVLIFLLLAGMVIYFINMNLKQEEEMKQINAEKEAMQKKIDKASKEAQEANEQAKEKERLLAEEQARLEAERKAEEEERKKAEKEQEEKNKKDPAYKAGLCPDANHPHAIDLGIGVKWACCNVGASAPWEYGNYYAWGETTTKNVYDDETYKYYDEINEEYINIGNEIAGTKYDVAHVKWGGKWKMPNQRQIEQLDSKCKYQWTTLNGVKGRKYTGRNGKSLFLPAAGARGYDSASYVGYYGYYWSSTQYPNYSSSAYYLYFDSGGTEWNVYSRYFGHSVRPVTEQ